MIYWNISHAFCMWDDRSCEVSDALGEHIPLSSEAFLSTFFFLLASHTEVEDSSVVWKSQQTFLQLFIHSFPWELASVPGTVLGIRDTDPQKSPAHWSFTFSGRRNKWGKCLVPEGDKWYREKLSRRRGGKWGIGVGSRCRFKERLNEQLTEMVTWHWGWPGSPELLGVTGKKHIILDGLMADNGGQAVTPLDFFWKKSIFIYFSKVK